jgi:hypothetical protein
MNSTGPKPIASVFRGTVRWSCRAGEYVLWVGTDSILTSNQKSAWTIRDFWQMRDGDLVTITAKWADLPEWFELHPSEVAGKAAIEMKMRLDEGYRPDEPMDGPNIWRAKAGDRLVWVTASAPSQPIVELLDLRTCVLAVGESSAVSLEQFIFGAPESDEAPPAHVAAARAGFDAAVGLGAPRVFAPEWTFGA